MNHYPAIRARMGSWQYFIIRTTMEEAAQNVRFASEVWNEPTLDRAIQRTLNTSRVKKEMVHYLARQDDRFFSSIVVAALGGQPQWYPVEMSDDPRFDFLRGGLKDTFGVLQFDGKQRYFALDGQHRLASIKALVTREEDLTVKPPKGFEHETISMIVVVPKAHESRRAFLERYRRLFGNLNRYAKQTDRVTNIIMDEDDVFAILTRRLIIEHEFFHAQSEYAIDSPRIKMKSGKMLPPTSNFFTSLVALYGMNKILLSSRERINDEWLNITNFIKFRPDDDTLEVLFDELMRYWDALLEVLPSIRQEPVDMRRHDIPGQDSALFWPLSQEMMCELARDLLDSADPGQSIKETLRALGGLNWQLHAPPWKHLFLVPKDPVAWADGESKRWKIRSEDRKPVKATLLEILGYQVGVTPFTADGLVELRTQWQELLVPTLDEAERDRLWHAIMEGASR